jgi:D-glycero-D-manno-heptose 1,7-bisphosphate phosphatase
MSRAAFLDRDGVINRRAPKGEYVTRWEDVRILPGVAAAIAQLNQAGFRVIVVTNQRCVAKGLLTTADLESMHQRMRDALTADGATLDGIYYCPHETQPACSCRKPAPGMLLAAARRHELNLAESWMIGDSDIDVAAGRSAGCKTARLLSGTENAHGSADVVAPSLLDAVRQILRRENLMADRGAADFAQGSRREPATGDGVRRH